MSYASTVKEELLRLPLGKRCCMLAELAALTETSGSLSLGGGGIGLTWRVESAALARRLFSLLKERVAASPTVEYVKHSRLGGQRSSILSVQGEEARRLLAALDMMAQEPDGTWSLSRTSPHLGITRQCCQRAFLRAAWLGCGTMSAPEKGYHLEWAAGDESLAQTLMRQLERAGLDAAVYQRQGKQVVYLKDGQKVSDALALMGASGAMLQLENQRIQRQLRADANRARNCDEHNGERMLNAAQKQLEAIHLISIQRGLSSLPPELEGLARLRLDHAEMSLTELGQMLDPPLGKSGVNHRMRRILDIAERLRASL